MNEEKQDLRVTKTKRAIMTAFNELIVKKPLDKITVTELAQKAEINKGTFYLHYTDLYALYQEALLLHTQEIIDEITFFDCLLTDPHTFAERMINGKHERVYKFRDDPYFSNHQNRDKHAFGMAFTTAISEQALRKSGLEPTETNRIKLMYLFSGIPPLIRMENEQTHDLTVELLTNTIYAIFPEITKNKSTKKA